MIHFAGLNLPKNLSSQAATKVIQVCLLTFGALLIIIAGHIRTWDRPKDVTNESEAASSTS